MHQKHAKMLRIPKESDAKAVVLTALPLAGNLTGRQ